MTIRIPAILSSVFLLAAWLLVVPGCGSSDGRPELGRVEGTVTLDGAALPGATITFQPAQGKSSRGVTDAEGHYELVYLRDIKGAVVGSHTVTITTASEASPQEKLPARYNANTELKKEVAAGSNTIDFALESK